MEFKELNEQIQKQFVKMQQTGKLFRVKLTGAEIWDLYINSFTKEQNPIFRDPDSSSNNCNCCKNFIRRYGNIVSIDENNKIISMFDVEASGDYHNSIKAVSKKIKSSKVSEVFFETFKELNSLNYEKCSLTANTFQLGLAKNVKRYTKEEAEMYGVVKPNEIRTFNHFNIQLNKAFVDTSNKSVESIMATYRDAKNVFKRAMDGISLDTLNMVKDLINQGSLFDGETHLYKIEEIIPLKTEYDKINPSEQDNWCWLNSYKLPFAKFRNELIGTLCCEISDGIDLNEACKTWNKRVDPVNYMKAKAPFTEKQKNEAKKFIEENGYTESFDRRFATMDDIKASEILHLNVGSGEIKSVSIFDNVKSTKSQDKKNEFNNVEEVSIDKFMKDILPSCSSVEVYLKNSHSGNMVTMTTANNPDSKPMFKWDNNYSKTFNGNLAGKSEIKEVVKSLGGNVEAILRSTISWNEDGKSVVDFDLHAIEPTGNEIYFSRNKGINDKSKLSGYLDIDMINPSKLGIENITWVDKSKMKDGVYEFYNKNYNGRNNNGFKAEIEFDGEIYLYEYKGNAQGNVKIAEVTLKNGQFTIKHLLPCIESNSISKNLYGLDTNQFHKVNLICLSPNHWGKNNVGNKFYMFMLEGCKTPNAIRSFHSEDLIGELANLRSVLETLGAVNMIEPNDEKQLSGLGFNATVRDEIIVKCSGNFKRMLKIKF